MISKMDEAGGVKLSLMVLGTCANIYLLNFYPSSPRQPSASKYRRRLRRRRGCSPFAFCRVFTALFARSPSRHFEPGSLGRVFVHVQPKQIRRSSPKRRSAPARIKRTSAATRTSSTPLAGGTRSVSDFKITRRHKPESNCRRRQHAREGCVQEGRSVVRTPHPTPNLNFPGPSFFFP